MTQKEVVEETPVVERPFPVSKLAADTASEEIIRKSLRVVNLDTVNQELTIMAKDHVLMVALDDLSIIRTGLTIRGDLIVGESDQDADAKLYRWGATMAHRALAEEARLRNGGVLPNLTSRTPDIFKEIVFHLRGYDSRARTYESVAQMLHLVEIMSSLQDRLRAFEQKEPELARHAIDLMRDDLSMISFGIIDIYGLYLTNAQIQEIS